MPTDLTNTTIVTTYSGMLHSQGAPLSAGGRTIIYDSIGNPSSIALGVFNTGVSLTGVTSGSCQFYTNILTTRADTPNTLITKSYIDSLFSGADPLLGYPIGSIYLSVVATSPSTLFGGTWVAFAPGRLLIGVGTVTDAQPVPQVQVFTAGACGGELKHTLTAAGLPNHCHQYSMICVTGTYQGLFDKGQGGRGHLVCTDPTNTSVCSVLGSGGGGSHNNLQPYLVVYMWKRTA